MRKVHDDQEIVSAEIYLELRISNALHKTTCENAAQYELNDETALVDGSQEYLMCVCYQELQHVRIRNLDSRGYLN